jgi:uncharacterized membrane protein YvbJ
MGMITCDNCGAQYDEEADKCPYCGSDNFGKAVQEHEDIINGKSQGGSYVSFQENRCIHFPPFR